MSAIGMPHGVGSWILLAVVVAVVLLVMAGFVGRALVRRGLAEPYVVKAVNRLSERIVTVIKRPITIAVMDEVADVLRTGNYTRNTASALRENHEEIKAMIAEKIKADPSGKVIGLLPFHERIMGEVTEASLRVIFEVLADPRTDELVSDVLRDNIDQIRQAVRRREEQ